MKLAKRQHIHKHYHKFNHPNTNHARNLYRHINKQKPTRTKYSKLKIGSVEKWLLKKYAAELILQRMRAAQIKHWFYDDNIIGLAGLLTILRIASRMK